MTVQVRETIDVAARAGELGCRVPVRIALLPSNFATAANSGEFHYHAATSHIRSAWQSVGLEDEGPQARDMTHPTHSVILSESDESRNLSARSGQAQSSTIRIASQADTPAESAKLPLVVFFGVGLSEDSAWRVAIALGMVSSVLASNPRCASLGDIRLHVVVQRSGGHGCACIEYQGDAFGIVALTREVRRVWPDCQR
jgi:hypothetical protein